VVAASSEAQAASSSAAAIAEIILRRILSSHPLCLSHTVRDSAALPETKKAGLFGNSATDGWLSPGPQKTPGIARNIKHYCLLSKGDQAGSEPSMGVFRTLSLCPVRSIEWSWVRPPWSWV